jgi:steroid delta-isomerase-like uncharacterized protein
VDPRALVRRYYDEVWVKGNVDAIDELLTRDYVDHTPPDDTPPRERLKRVASIYRDAATDVELDVEVLVSDEDRAAAYWTMRWIQRGDFFGVAADGKRLVLRGAQFFRLRDGKIAENWNVDDYVRLFGQLGLTLKL